MSIPLVYSITLRGGEHEWRISQAAMMIDASFWLAHLSEVRANSLTTMHQFENLKQANRSKATLSEKYVSGRLRAFPKRNPTRRNQVRRSPLAGKR
jgi:hypothetical protein